MTQFNDHEQQFIDAWPEHLQPIAQQNLLNEYTGWREIVADMDASEFVAKTGFSSNSFSYPHIGHSSYAPEHRSTPDALGTDQAITNDELSGLWQQQHFGEGC